MIKEVWFSKLARLFGFVVTTQKQWVEVHKMCTLFALLNANSERNKWYFTVFQHKFYTGTDELLIDNFHIEESIDQKTKAKIDMTTENAFQSNNWQYKNCDFNPNRKLGD